MRTIPVVHVTSIAIKQRAEQNARRQGLSVAEYISKLVTEDEQDSWGEPPKAVIEQWDKAEREFDARDRTHPQPRFTSGEEIVNYIRHNKK